MSGSISSIQQYYQNILQRAPDQAGLNSFANANAAGLPLAQVESLIATSAEAAAFVDPVVQMYEAILGRTPDSAGLSGFVNAYRSGTMSLGAIAAVIVNSPEGQRDLGGTSVTATTIQYLYQHALGRSASAAELANFMNDGASLATIAQVIADSPEATNYLSGQTLSYLLGAGTGTTTPTGGQTISISGAQTTFTGTTGSDVFLAPTTQSQFTGALIPSLLNTTVINGNGGSDLLQATLTGGTVSPTLTGVAAVQVVNSPGIGETFDLSKSNGVTETDVTTSPGSNVSYTNATGLTGASIQNSATTTLTVSTTGAIGIPVATGSIVNSPGSTLRVLSDSSPALAVTVTNSPAAALSLTSVSATTGVSGLTINDTASTPSSPTAYDALAVTDNDATGTLRTLTLNLAPTGYEALALSPTTAAAATVTVANLAVTGAAATTAASAGAVSLGTLSGAATFDSSGYTGALASTTTPSRALAAAEASTVPAAYAGVTPGVVGLAVNGDAALTSIRTGVGNSVISLVGEGNARAPYTVSLGAGNNFLILGGTPTTTATYTGGSGSNAIGISNGIITTGGDAFSNFQTLEIGPNSSTVPTGGIGTYNLARLAGVSTVTLTGSGNAAALTGAVVLDNAPDRLSIVETAASGSTLASQGNSLQVNLGAVSGNAHTVSITLNADGASTDTAAAAPGVVTAGPLTIGQLAGGRASASFQPGTSSETINIASNIANAAGSATASSYTNTISFVTANDARTFNFTGNANLVTGPIQASTNLVSINAGAETGNVTTSVNIGGGAQTGGFTYTGSSGTDTVSFNATNTVSASGVAAVTNTFIGGAGNDRFTVADGGGNVFAYRAATDANLSDTNVAGPSISDASTTLNVETIGGFTPSFIASTSAADTINLAGLSIGSSTVIIGGAAGSNYVTAGNVGGTLLNDSTNLSSVQSLFGGSANQSDYLNGAIPGFGTVAANTVAGAYVYQAADNSVYVLADANNDRNFGSASDTAIHLAGNFTAAQVRAIATDLKFS